MPPDPTQLLEERFSALLEMTTEGGKTPPGQLPASTHLDALRATERIGEAAEIRDAHKNGNPP